MKMSTIRLSTSPYGVFIDYIPSVLCEIKFRTGFYLYSELNRSLSDVVAKQPKHFLASISYRVPDGELSLKNSEWRDESIEGSGSIPVRSASQAGSFGSRGEIAPPPPPPPDDKLVRYFCNFFTRNFFMWFPLNLDTIRLPTNNFFMMYFSGQEPIFITLRPAGVGEFSRAPHEIHRTMGTSTNHCHHYREHCRSETFSSVREYSNNSKAKLLRSYIELQ